MSILAVSISHKTTSVDILAKVAMDSSTSTKLAEAMIASEHVDEAVVLSTCNRTEMYASVSRFHGGLDDVTVALAQLSGVGVGELRQLCAVYFDEGAVAHTFAVSSGLDSMVVGENQILGQVKSALTACQAHGTVGTGLNALFQQALRVGKRVHTETEVGSAGRSLVTAAYEVLRNDVGPIGGRRLLVVGAGSMASLAARTAAAAGAQVTCVNRTYDRARRLAEAIGAQARPLAELEAALQQTDLIVTCTGARDVFLDAEHLLGTPVVGVVDLALPADVSEDVTNAGVVLVNLARLVADQPDHASRAEVEAARALVSGEVNDFLGVRRAAQVAPTVVALRSMASEVVSAELARLDGRAPDLTERERQEVHRTVRRVVDKLLHQPTVRVQELSANPESVDYAAALRELFALDPQTIAAVMSPEVMTTK
ncbi:glutamyl-tRNA reductase [Microlunatus phosphovorus NM-1]|uniref:Glutamyl-tRNA reductase n=1 Tax=Microlunatus phosphovorus (strain ATCC 700054 / DSM 10555 / JCM 9379 / NBRC 101784 / NCIMB 13414 / VKM Ac-1990 / NM-1) TaxID=1032480 RepID=F5XF76_MICPN|nr:glutamyl-tRNA reductase [Microlunatus phosphovorus]BAK37814.1 glutamyl-tRNA reductase [Microlunatus phosphovorus NM-1]